MERIVEICTGSYQDCLDAYHGGAKRVELNSALSVGGLTPSVAVLRQVKRDTDLKVICMVRPRAAGFCYEPEDVRIMMEDARILLEEGADGIAFGFLTPDAQVEKGATARMCDLIHSFGKEAVFHRAFDVCADPFAAMDILIACGIDRLLTSGQQEKAAQGVSLIRMLQARFHAHIEILAGSGVNAGNARQLMAATGIHQVHSSCKTFSPDPTTRKGPVSYAYLSGPHEDEYDVVSEELVRQLVQAVQRD